MTFNSHAQRPSEVGRSVVVVGGGITGLSTAWYLAKHNQAAGQALQVTVLETQDRFGGKVLTERIEVEGVGAFTVEAGPDSYLTQKPWAGQLAAELGLAGQIIGTNDASRKVYVVHRGRPTPLPDGVFLIVPTKFKPFVLSPLISPLGKLRMGLDLLIPPKRDGDDETLADFVTRRLGREALDKIAEPLMSGIYNAEAERQSVLATFPRYRDLEAKYGSLTRGILATRRNSSGQKAHNATNARKPSAFESLHGGTQELTDTLAELLEDKANLRTGASVVALGRTNPDEPCAGWSVILTSGERIRADAVVLACPAFVAADLLRPLEPGAADRLASIRYVGTGTVSLAYRATDIEKARAGGFGLVVPMSEQRPVNAVTFSSIKFDHRAPAGYVLLRVFFGGSRSPRSMELGDSELLRTVCGELDELLGIRGEPLFHRIYRWPRSNPQYDVGHLGLLSGTEGQLPKGIFVTGSPYRGVGLPDCVKQSQETAAQVIADLSALQEV